MALYRVNPANRNCEIETAIWTWVVIDNVPSTHEFRCVISSLMRGWSQQWVVKVVSPANINTILTQPARLSRIGLFLASLWSEEVK